MLLAFIAILFRGSLLYIKLGNDFAGDSWEIPSILYGRPTKIRVGDHLGNLRFEERLKRLSYTKVSGTPDRPGTYSLEPERVRIFTRGYRIYELPSSGGPAEMEIRDNRVTSIVTRAGNPLEAVRLEPEEITRILGPKRESRRLIPLSSIPDSLKNAVIASEDMRFYSHLGIDFVGIARATVTNLKNWRFVQGGSTITQQVAKNFFLSPKKTLMRKLREAELAIIIELRFTKDEILEMYLNKIYFGQDGTVGIYGIEEAARFYFSKEASDLTTEESALLAGIIRSPNRYSPLKDKRVAKERRNTVLLQMRRMGMISEDELRRASTSLLSIRPNLTQPRSAPYFTDYIQRITADELGDDELFRTGYRFNTTLDPLIQSLAEKAVTEGLADIGKMLLSSNSGEPLQAALVAVDPTSGEMIAMVGGREYGITQFNRATNARRQPGSAFKPFVLLTAMRQTAEGKGENTLSTIISGESITFQTTQGPWTPANSDGKTYGNISIRTAIENSVNTATVRLANEAGFDEVVKTARAAGITSRLPAMPSMPLGSFEVTPIELAYAYATIASRGIRFDPFPLFSVTNADGGIISEKKVRRERAIDPRAAYLTAYAMEGTIERGTGRIAKALGVRFPASGKTGTTNDNRDSWFVGFTPDIVCAVWVGYDSEADTKLTGARGALRIWSRFMQSVYPEVGPAVFAPPDGVEFAEIDPASGFLITSECTQKFREAYLVGTAPKDTCPIHPVAPVVDNLRKGFKSLGDYFRSLFK